MFCRFNLSPEEEFSDFENEFSSSFGVHPCFKLFTPSGFMKYVDFQFLLYIQENLFETPSNLFIWSRSGSDFKTSFATLVHHMNLAFWYT